MAAWIGSCFVFRVVHEDATELTPVVRAESGAHRAFDLPRLLPVVRLADQDAPTAPTALPRPKLADPTEPTRAPRGRPPPRAPSTLPRPVAAEPADPPTPPTAMEAPVLDPAEEIVDATRLVPAQPRPEPLESVALREARSPTGVRVLKASIWLKLGVFLAAAAWLTLIAAWAWAWARA